MQAQNFISEAMIALVNAQRVLTENSTRPTPPPVSEGLRLSLTDEDSPVRVQHGDTWMDLNFREAAQLFLELGGISQIREYAEELKSGADFWAEPILPKR